MGTDIEGTAAEAALCCQMHAMITRATVSNPTRRPTGSNELLGAWYAGAVPPCCAASQSDPN